MKTHSIAQNSLKWRTWFTSYYRFTETAPFHMANLPAIKHLLYLAKLTSMTVIYMISYLENLMKCSTKLWILCTLKTRCTQYPNKQIKCEVYEDIRRKDEEEAVDGSPPGAKACSYSMRYLTNVRRCYTFINWWSPVPRIEFVLRAKRSNKWDIDSGLSITCTNLTGFSIWVIHRSFKSVHE